LKLVLAKTKVFWGYSIKYPTQTAAQDSIPIPPPTTALGALAAAYAKYLKLPETLIAGGRIYSTAAKLLLDGIVKYATSALITPVAVKHSDVTRNIMLIYQRHRESKYHFAAQAMSKVYATSIKNQLVLAYVVRDDQAELISKIAWGITAVGCKEGLVSVNEVAVYNIPASIVKAGTTAVTHFITPSELALCERSCTEVELCELTPQSYLAGRECSRKTYLVPLSPKARDVFGGSMKIRVKTDTLLLELPLTCNVKTSVLLPKEVVD